MKKKLYFVFALSLVGLLSSCVKVVNRPEVRKEEEKNVKVRQFNRIKVSAFCDVHYEQGDSLSVRIVGSQKSMSRLRTICDGTTLTIEQTKRAKCTDLGRYGDVDVYVTSPDLVEVSMNGAGDFKVKSHLDTDTFNVRMEGAGDIEIEDLICDQIHVTLKGAGDVELKNVIASYSDIRLKGVGDVKVNFKRCDRVTCELEGVGDIKVAGQVGRIRHDVKGTGTIDLDDLHVLEK